MRVFEKNWIFTTTKKIEKIERKKNQWWILSTKTIQIKKNMICCEISYSVFLGGKSGASSVVFYDDVCVSVWSI